MKAAVVTRYGSPDVIKILDAPKPTPAADGFRWGGGSRGRAKTLFFKPGDRVFGMCPSKRNGAHAEYVAVPERTVAIMPAGARFD
jgi:NADPH:quinone reductase-like Zn-dependent oxidoreductase